MNEVKLAVYLKQSHENISVFAYSIKTTSLKRIKRVALLPGIIQYMNMISHRHWVPGNCRQLNIENNNYIFSDEYEDDIDLPDFSGAYEEVEEITEDISIEYHAASDYKTSRLKILKDGKEIFYIEYVSPHEPDIDEFMLIENREITNFATLPERKNKEAGFTTA